VRRLIWLVLLCALGSVAHAGGPLLVGNNGVAQTWANGQILYYTDQGNLSPLLPLAQADQFVADAWAEWSSVPLASLQVIHGGRLSVDVTGANFAVVSDLLPDSGKPIAIVYDADGSVMNALLGQGAGSSDLCSTNGVYEQVDGIAEDGHLAHALVVINGNCATTPANLAVLHYQLVRALGRVLGLDYSQLNENVVTGSPSPTSADYAAYPVMHPLGVICTYDSGCMANAEVPRMDDRAALARLYPAALFASTTARVYGTVRFPHWRGAMGQGMQGVNVVAKLIDPTSGRISTQYSASSVSGFLFSANAGNPVTGFTNALGDPWNVHGSSDLSLEGLYDLSGLEIPQGYNSATYQISVEPVNALYSGSTSVGPYVVSQVATNGSAAPVRVTVAAGAEVAQDFTMQGAAPAPQDRWEPSSFAAPSAIPLEGSWTASLSSYGDRDYYSMPIQANRTLTFDVTAIDETGAANVNRALPVLGLWAQESDENTPALTQTYFNALPAATTRLSAAINSAGTYEFGVMDYRGDGRPDFLYTAHLYYADQLYPAHVGVQGGSVVMIEGFGFTATTQVSVNGSPVTATYLAPNQVQFQTPALSDGTYTVVVSDTATGAGSQMTNALLVGAVNAKLVLLNGTNPTLPVGVIAPYAFSARVVDSSTGAALAGATVLFSAPSSIGLVGCSRNPCPVVSDQNGIASVQMLVQQSGASVITAMLAAGGSVSATVNAVASSLALGLAKQNAYVIAGIGATVPISAIVLANNVPSSGKTVNFAVTSGTAQLLRGSVTTDSTGTANTQATVNGISAPVSISACVAPANTPCRIFMIDPVSGSTVGLQAVSGNAQTVVAGQSFAPLVMRVTDSAGDPVTGVSVAFAVHIFRVIGVVSPIRSGEALTLRSTRLVVFSSSSGSAMSDVNGLVTIPGITSPAEAVQVTVHVAAGSVGFDAHMVSVLSNSISYSLPASLRVLLPYPLRVNNLRKPLVQQEWYLIVAGSRFSA